MISPIPSNEAQRLSALRDYAILDTPAELKYDDIVALAAEICDTPISAITLIDESRQWLKAKVGLDFSETTRDIAFCAHGLDQTELLLVPDATLDARFSDNPLVQGEAGICFYAGAPLVTPGGEILGTLCVIDRVPRELNDKQLCALRVLSQNVMTQLELSRQIREAKEQSALLHDAQDLADMGSWELNLLTNKLRWSANTCHLFGIEPADFGGSFAEFLEFVVPEDRTSVEDMEALAATSVLVLEAEYRIRRADGEIRWMFERGKLVTDDNEKPLRRRGVVMDITRRHRREDHLRLLETSISLLNDIVIITEAQPLDAPGPRIQFVNDAFERLTGYSKAEVIGRSPRLLHGPKTSRTELDRIREAVENKASVRAEIINYSKTGEEFWFDIDIVPIVSTTGTTTHFVAVQRDITGRKLTEKNLIESENRFRALFEQSPIGIATGEHNEAGVVIINQRYCDILGYTREELMQLDYTQFTHPDDLPADLANMELLAAGKIRHFTMEKRLIRKDGSLIWVSLTIVPLGDTSETPELYMAVVEDINDRKLADAILLENQERLIEQATLLDHARDAIVVKDLADHIIYWNKGAERTYGWTAAEALGRITSEFLCKDSSKYTAAIAQVQLDGQWVGEITKFHKQGRALTMDASLTLVRDTHGKPKSILAICTDVTEKKKLEAQFLRAQRMDSIGTLAGGIAHDLNNMLAPVLMSLEILRMKFPDAETAKLLDTLQSSAQRGANLVRQVLSFARGVEGQHSLINPLHIIREIQKIAHDTFPKNITFDLQTDQNIWTINADPTQMHQVLLNLCVNARDAMPEGGKLSVIVKNSQIDDTYAAMNPGLQPGNYVSIEVADTGSGIPADIHDKIFEPFFTTKEIGKGTGLGLSTTMAIIKSHSGSINLYSEMGKGTLFKVLLPANTGEYADTPPVLKVDRIPRGHGELILVVDDEAAIREIVRETLENFGYQVLLATHGAEAVQFYAQRQKEIALVLTDMAMPIMDGPATIIALRTINPLVKIIGSSGLTTNAGYSKAHGAGSRHFVPKPYTAEILLQKLKEVLEEN